MSADIPFGQANRDALNPGVYDENGKRKPTSFTAHVDDNVYAEIAKYLRRAIAVSMVSVDESFGGSHEYQEDILSDEKLNLLYEEIRILLGRLPNSRSMIVDISPCRREKTITYIEQEGWLDQKRDATIRDIARIFGLLHSICDINIWGRAQLLVLQHLLAECIRNSYNLAQRNF